MGVPLVLVALLAWWTAPTAAAKWRAQASLNYNELALPDTCVDLKETCYDDVYTGACLFNPYEIRSRCPLSCRVQRCNARKGQQYRISGHATAAGTFEYSTRMARLGYVTKGHFRLAYTSIGPGDPVPATALMLSSLGTSAYLQAPDSSSHSPLAAPEDPIVPAILHAITHGWNVLDIAQGSHVGRAESVLGEALTAMLAGSSFEAFPAHPSRSYTTASRQETQGPGDLTRDMVFVSTKAGILDALVARRLLGDGTIGRTDVIYEVDDSATGSPESHPMACLHPACLKHNLDTSLERLQLRTVDLLYLDRVESHLRAVGTQATMERLRAAFKTLEGMREAQQIMFYGLATWESFAVSAGQDEHLDLAAVVALAKEVGGEQHGFRFIQVPLSLSVPEAWSAVTQHVGTANVTLLEAAKKLRIQVFTSDPLNGGNVKWLGMRGAMVEQMAGVHGGGGKVLQWVRSTPGVLSTLVHHTARGHVETNVQLAKVKPLDKAVHQTVHDRLLEVLKT